ncbi:hypothetical protein ES705_15219 [subsurface metagenome]
MMEELTCCIIKGQYPHKCDMEDCDDIVCDICGYRVIHESANKEQFEWLQTVMGKSKIYKLFNEVCYDHALEVVKHGISVVGSETRSRTFVGIYKNALIDEKGNLG